MYTRINQEKLLAASACVNGMRHLTVIGMRVRACVRASALVQGKKSEKIGAPAKGPPPPPLAAKDKK